MRLHEQTRAVLVKPATAVALAQFDKIHGAIVFIAPIVVFDAARGNVDENYAAGAQERRHSAVGETDVSITMPGTSVRQHTFETAPLLDYAREEFGALGVEGRVEAQGGLERDGRGGKMGVWRVKGAAVGEAIFDGNIIPTEDLEGIQVIDNGEGIEFVKARGDTAIFDIREAADMKNQLRPAAARGQFKACALDVAIR